MKLELVVGLVIVFSTICLISLNDSNSKDVFSTWKESHQVQFQNEGEQIYRKRIFMKNLERINQFNSEESNLYKMGVNQFTIYTQEQFAQRYLNPISDQQIREVVRKSLNEDFQAVLIDWTEKGAVGPVRDQGSSGSSALYATLGGVQGFSKVKTGKLQTFSAQQLIDCVYGSTGSLLTEGYAYYKKHSVCTTDQYPFSGKPATCQEKNNCKFKISDYVEVKTCSDLANAIMKQPVSVAVDASNWYTYRSGIFTNCASSVNHMVLLVGIADQYWKCKNSWGVGWGQKGFIRLARGNTCGICSFAIYPV